MYLSELVTIWYDEILEGILYEVHEIFKVKQYEKNTRELKKTLVNKSSKKNERFV